ncbi:DUF2061 domain-containing protein [Henriciella marina]|uniref:DUF2061 domain-containing protein n=1 Tax=Henriciella marina TaxID=453851 RepID=UPI00058EDEB2|nr:DUF2061 domain-containing protein [Henriciella marina]
MTYSLMHLIVAVGVAYALTGNVAIALGIGLIEPAVQTIAYTIHENMWRRADRSAQSTAPESETSIVCEPA